ncbi:MAG: PAS domain-containing protein [Ferrovibrio sp.]
MIRPLSDLLETLTLPGHRAAAEHWLALYGAAGNRVPKLRDLDPLRFPAALPDVWIVDHGDDGRFRFHLLGQNMIDWRGANAKGLSFEEIYPPDRVPVVNSMALRVISEPAISHQQMLSRIRDWSLPIPVDRIAMPVCDEAGRIRHMFGVTIVRGQPGQGGDTEQIELQRDDWYPLAQADSGAPA